MLHLKNSLIVLGMLLLFTTSCKKDFTTVGNQLIEQPHFEGKLYTDAKVKVYDQRVDRVFATNLPTHAIGIYNDPVFGRLEADLVSAVQMIGIRDSNLEDPEISNVSDGFGDNVKLIEAKLVIPYFSHVEEDSAGDEFYEPDSVYGHSNFDLKIYENSYLLSALDPETNLTNLRSYYSDFDFNPYKTVLLADSTSFRPNFMPYITYKRNDDGTFELDDSGVKIVKDSLAPQFVMPLDTTFFRTKIFDHSGEDILSNEDQFRNYFRGIYIDAIAQNNDGRFFMLDIQQGKIVVSYTYEYTNDQGTSDTSDDTTETKYQELSIRLSTPMVNTYTNIISPTMQTALTNSDMINGDDKVYIKGDAGAETIVQLFDSQQLRELRERDWMINQVELIFYVDKNSLTNTLGETTRLLLYDYDNSEYLLDLHAPENATTGNTYFDGILNEDDDGNKYYSFKITRHIREVINNNRINSKLGLRVVSTINIEGNLLANDIFKAPDAYNPTGTILYGNQTTVLDKKPILKIYYTDPK